LFFEIVNRKRGLSFFRPPFGYVQGSTALNSRAERSRSPVIGVALI